MRSEREKMLAGEPYLAMDPELVAARVHARALCAWLNASLETLEPGNPAQAERRKVAEELFGAGGDSVWLQPPFFCDYGSNIELGEDVWVGGGAIILPGVRIGDRSVIAAGSVVTKDIPADVVAVGNPCRVLRPIEQ